eukprot:scaffold27362_cov63-Phaeocystis_antarctica.AAC.2
MGGSRAKYPGGRAHHGRGWASVVIWLTLLTVGASLGRRHVAVSAPPPRWAGCRSWLGRAVAIATAAGVLEMPK